MTPFRMTKSALSLACVALLAACSGNQDTDGSNSGAPQTTRESDVSAQQSGSIFDIFRTPEAEVKVNRFLWTASMDVLDFLPVEAADPFTGVITTGYGRPPGGGPPYRATILISDPALDARSLNVALQTQSGPVSAGTQRAVEDAILTRARQLRVNAGRF